MVSGGSADHPPCERLDAFSRGALTADEAVAIEDHLEFCAECGERVARATFDDGLLSLLRSVGRSTEVAATETPFTRYEILGVIGRGGMGVVYRARQRALGREVALKQIRLGLGGDAQELARFETEAVAAAGLRHPGIVQVHDVGWRDGEPFLAMELVEGGSLEERLRQGPLPPAEAATLIARVARAVQHAHDAGVVHRDLKPGNVLLAADGAPKIADFGLAKRLDAAQGPTRTGSLLGTPSYMAPEQAQGGPPGPAIDVYALGAVLYECLTGRPPFHAATVLETLDQVRTCEPPSPSRVQPGLPRDLQTITLKCLEKDPRRRYATAGALGDELERFLQGRPITARPVGPLTRTLKWARRRPSQASLAGLVAAVVTGSFAALLAHQARLQVEVNRANEAARVAGEQRALADANYREARAAIREILARLEDSKFNGIPRRVDLRAAQAESALRFYDRVLGAAGSPDPAVRLDTAVAAREAANLQIGLNHLGPAEANLLRSLRILDDLADTSPDDPTLLLERMTSWLKLGVMLLGRENDRAHTALTRALALAERLDRVEGGSRASQTQIAWCEHNIGSGLLIASKPAEARPHLLRSAAIRRGSLVKTPDDTGTQVMLAASLVNLGLIDAQANPGAAETAYAEAAGLLEKAHEAQPDEAETTLNLGGLLNNWANLAAARGEHGLAFARFARGLTLVEPIRRAEPSQDQPRRAVMNLSGSRANLLGALGRHLEAVPDWDRVIECNGVPQSAASYRLLRGFALARGGDHHRASADLESFRSDPASVRGLAGADLYNLACLASLIAQAAGRDTRLPEGEKKVRVGAHTRQALAWLRHCASSGFLNDAANRDQAWKDTDLEAARRLPGFAEIVPASSAPAAR